MKEYCFVFHNIGDIYGNWPLKKVMFAKVIGDIYRSGVYNEEVVFVQENLGYQQLQTLKILFNKLEQVIKIWDAERLIQYSNLPAHKGLFINFKKRINARLGK